MVLVGGHLNPAWILEAYRRGIFPWPMPGPLKYHVLEWYSPDPRTVIDLDRFHVPRRLVRRLRRGEFGVTLNRAFREVMNGCAERSEDQGTWITDELLAAYVQLHALGWAHSVEVWEGQHLVGGVYGVSLGGYFAAESMFHRRSDASKAALCFLVEHLRQREFSLLDAQVWSDHLRQFGATQIPRSQFLERLSAAIQSPCSF